MHIPEEEIHYHTHADGTVHAHTHAHTHTQTKSVINRLSRAIGHLESVKRMVESGRDCSEVLMSLRLCAPRSITLRKSYSRITLSTASRTPPGMKTPTSLKRCTTR